MTADPSGNKQELIKKWNACKDDMPPDYAVWTDRQEQQLQDALAGNINGFYLSRQMRHAKAVKCTYCSFG